MQGRLRLFLEETYGTPDFEVLVEQVFGETPFAIYGEGYGHKIQTGAGYFPDEPEGKNEFIGFDVRVDGRYLSPENTADVLKKLGIPMVPTLAQTVTIPELIHDMSNAIKSVEEGEPAIVHEGTDKEVEGYVLRPPLPLFDGRGNRVMAKVIMSDVRQVVGMVASMEEERRRLEEAAGQEASA